MRPLLGPVATADLDGVRTHLTVTFTKFYDGSGGMHHAVRYNGTANEALTRIDGRWTIPGDGSGTFFMTRDDAGEEAATEERVEEVISQKG